MAEEEEEEEEAAFKEPDRDRSALHALYVILALCLTLRVIGTVSKCLLLRV